MLDKVKQFFESHMCTNSTQEDAVTEKKLQVATAALLVEVMMQDEKADSVEVNMITTALQNNFSLTTQDASQLLELAKQELEESSDYYQFTRLIQQHYGQEEKQRIIELLWQVAYADYHLDAYEEHLIRKVSDLIYVAHNDFIRIKHKVARKWGVSTTFEA